MKDSIPHILSLVLFLTLNFCGQDSKVTCNESKDESAQDANCVQKDPDEKSVLMLNSGQYDQAIFILEGLINAEITGQEPIQHVRKVRLAAAYASKAKCSFLELIEAISDSPTDIDCESITYSRDNIIEEIAKTAALSSAIANIDSIPVDTINSVNETSENSDEKTKAYYLNSALLQNSLYRPVHTNKCLKLYNFIYSSPENRNVLSPEAIAMTSCQPTNMVKNLLNTAIDLISSLGCGDRIAEETCMTKQAELRQKALELEEKAASGSTSEQISNLMVAACKEENPDAECPPVIL